MNPQTEAQSLVENPLPHELAGSAYDYGVVDKDAVLTTITYIDDEVWRLKIIIDFLNGQRSTLLRRAVDEKIASDDTATLVENYSKLYRNPIEDLISFATEFPGGYKIIRKNQVDVLRKEKKSIDNDIENIDKMPISLTEAYDVLGKSMVTAFVGTKPQEITYDVVKKRKYPKELK